MPSHGNPPGEGPNGAVKGGCAAVVETKKRRVGNVKTQSVLDRVCASRTNSFSTYSDMSTEFTASIPRLQSIR